jgi:hypothetical protein
VRLKVIDETRFGLISEHRRAGLLLGGRVVMPHQQKYEWQYVMGALEAGEADSEFAYESPVNTQIARHDPRAVHRVTYDGVGFHPEEHFPVVPENVRIIEVLPSYSPELNPIEGLWDQM